MRDFKASAHQTIASLPANSPEVVERPRREVRPRRTAIRLCRFAFVAGDAKRSAGGACGAGPKRANGVRKQRDRYPKGQDAGLCGLVSQK